MDVKCSSVSCCRLHCQSLSLTMQCKQHSLPSGTYILMLINTLEAITNVVSRQHLRSARRHYLVVPRQLPGTHWVMICVIRCLALTVSDVCWKLGCFQSTCTHSALEASHFMRYISSRLTCLLIYDQAVYCQLSEANLCHRRQHSPASDW